MKKTVVLSQVSARWVFWAFGALMWIDAARKGGKWNDDDSRQDIRDGSGSFSSVVCGNWGHLPLGRLDAFFGFEGSWGGERVAVGGDFSGGVGPILRGPLSKKNIITALLEEYDIETAEDI